MDNNVQIFSLLDLSSKPSIYGLRSVKFAFIERENIFLHVYPQFSF